MRALFWVAGALCVATVEVARLAPAGRRQGGVDKRARLPFARAQGGRCTAARHWRPSNPPVPPAP